MQRASGIPDNWRQVLAAMFDDKRFKEIDSWLWFAEIDGKRVGVAVATRSSRFDTHALNQQSLDRLIEAKRSGKVDNTFIVAARIDALNNISFIAANDAEYLQTVLLQKMRTRTGRHGQFWTLTEHMIATGVADPNDTPF
jgi:hypothetical protein